MLLQLLLLSLFLIYVLRTYLWFLWCRVTRRLPGGPLPLPFIGNVLALDPERPHISYTELAQKHGKLFSFMLGNRPIIVIADLELTKKVFREARAAGRPKTIHDYMNIGTNQGIVFWEGETWRELRRFSMTALKDSGMVEGSVEDYIQEETTKILDQLNAGDPVDSMMLMTSATANIISRLLFGRTFDTNTQEFRDFIRDILENFRQSMSGPLEVLPWLRFFPPFKGVVSKTRIRYLQILRTIRGFVDEHKDLFDTQNPHDYVDMYLKEQRTGNPAFTAGIETTASTAQWAFLYMIANPDIQRKLQRELDRELGPDGRMPSADISRLPYLEAVILEVSRIASIVPFFLPHKALEDMEIAGYRVSAGMEILALNWTMSHDPEIWPQPSMFVPERFLDQEGMIDHKKSQLIIPFSIGKRVCPGESLARKELAIFLGTIFKNYTLYADNGRRLSMDPVNGAVLGVSPFGIMAVKRDEMSRTNELLSSRSDVRNG